MTEARGERDTAAATAAQEEEEYQDAVKKADLMARKGGESQELVRAIFHCCVLTDPHPSPRV